MKLPFMLRWLEWIDKIVDPWLARRNAKVYEEFLRDIGATDPEARAWLEKRK